MSLNISQQKDVCLLIEKWEVGVKGGGWGEWYQQKPGDPENSLKDNMVFTCFQKDAI